MWVGGDAPPPRPPLTASPPLHPHPPPPRPPPPAVEALWVVRLLRFAPEWLLSVIADCSALLFFNRITLWFGVGIPFKQYQVRGEWGV